MRNLILPLVLLFMLAGCSFKDSQSQGGQPSSKAQNTKALQLGIIDLNQSAELIPGSENEYSVSLPYPVETDVPDSLQVSISSLKEFGDRLPGVRVIAEFNESDTELPVTNVKAQPIENGGGDIGLGITFDVHGLRNLLPPSESRSVTLKIRLMGVDNKTTTISTTLQTPPSRLKLKSLTVSEFYWERRDLDEPRYSQIHVDNHRFILLRVLEITNNEPEAVEITVPQRGYGKIHTRVMHKTYEDLGCDYRIHENVEEIINEGPFEVFPIQGNTFKIVNDRVNLGEAYKAEFKITLEPNSSVNLGLYGSNPDTHELVNPNRPSQDLEVHLVNTTCEKKCFKTDVICEPSPRDPVFGVGRSLLSRGGNCQEVCVDERTIRHQKMVMLGEIPQGDHFIPSDLVQDFSTSFPTPIKTEKRVERHLPFLSAFLVEGLFGQ